jgi:hypothetical protein
MRRGSNPRNFSATKRAIDGGVNTMNNGEKKKIKEAKANMVIGNICPGILLFTAHPTTP